MSQGIIGQPSSLIALSSVTSVLGRGGVRRDSAEWEHYTLAKAMIAVETPYSDLAHAYESGLLTPFLGAGMSAPLCPLWSEFIERLESRCGIARPKDLGNEGESLIRRAASAVNKLRNI